MALANSDELRTLVHGFKSALRGNADFSGNSTWGWPGGSNELQTYFFLEARLDIGVVDRGNRWAFLIHRSRPYPSLDFQSDQLVPDFEMNVPKSPHRALAFYYESVDPANGKRVEARHTGKFTLGKGRLKMQRFFEYYDTRPGRWQTGLDQEWHRYLSFFTFDIDNVGSAIHDFISTAAIFADYVKEFKDSLRPYVHGPRP